MRVKNNKMKINWKTKSPLLPKRPLNWSRSFKKCKNNWIKRKKSIIKTNKLLSQTNKVQRHQTRRSPPWMTKLRRTKTRLSNKNKRAKRPPMSYKKSKKTTSLSGPSTTLRYKSYLKTKIPLSSSNKWNSTRNNGLIKPVMMIESSLPRRWHLPPKIGFQPQPKLRRFLLRTMSECKK